MNWYLVLLQAHGAGGQEALIPVLDGERQVLVKHLQVSLHTRGCGCGCVCVNADVAKRAIPACIEHSHTPSGREPLQGGDAVCHEKRSPSSAKTCPA